MSWLSGYLLENRVIHLARPLVQTPPPLQTYSTKTQACAVMRKRKNSQTDEPVLKQVCVPTTRTRLRIFVKNQIPAHTPVQTLARCAYTRHTPSAASAPTHANIRQPWTKTVSPSFALILPALRFCCSASALFSLSFSLSLSRSLSLPRRHLHRLLVLRFYCAHAFLQASSSKDFTTRSQIPPSPSFVSY
jgi:hypothetical protein